MNSELDVLIVGGGGAGLTASMLLSQLGVDHLLINARPGTSDLPEGARAQPADDGDRREPRVAERISERGTPPDAMAASAFYAGFAGPNPDYGRPIAKLECWGAGGADERSVVRRLWRDRQVPLIGGCTHATENEVRWAPGRSRRALAASAGRARRRVLPQRW